MPPGKQNPLPSAQEIAEKHAATQLANLETWLDLQFEAIVRAQLKIIFADSIRSAITAAVAQEAKMLDWILGTADGREFIEYSMEHTIPIDRPQIRKAMLNFDWPVAQAKEEEKPNYARMAIRDLELKEPATD